MSKESNIDGDKYGQGFSKPYKKEVETTKV